MVGAVATAPSAATATPAHEPARAAGSGVRVVDREAGPGFGAEVPGVIGLGGELEIDTRAVTGGGLDLEAEVGKLDVTVDYRQTVSSRDRGEACLAFDLGHRRLGVRRVVELTLEFVVEDHPVHDAPVARQARRFLEIHPVQAAIVNELRRADPAAVDRLLRASRCRV